MSFKNLLICFLSFKTEKSCDIFFLCLAVFFKKLLFLELIKGDQWLFVSREEIETSWDWCDQIIDAWNKNKSPTRLYSAGSGGPAKAEVLIESDGRSWHGQ